MLGNSDNSKNVGIDDPITNPITIALENEIAKYILIQNAVTVHG